MPKKIEYLYLCNGCACKEMCANKDPKDWENYECHHTSNEKFAKNKVRRDRKFKTITIDDYTERMVEVEK